MLMELVEAVADILRGREWSTAVEVRSGLWSDLDRGLTPGVQIFVAPQALVVERTNRGAWMWHPQVTVAVFAPLAEGDDVRAAIDLVEEAVAHCCTLNVSDYSLKQVSAPEIRSFDEASAMHVIAAAIDVEFMQCR